MQKGTYVGTVLGTLAGACVRINGNITPEGVNPAVSCLGVFPFLLQGGGSSRCRRQWIRPGRVDLPKLPWQRVGR